MAGNTPPPPAVTAAENTTTEKTTISYLLFRVLSGNKICKATELAACLPQWLSDIEDNNPIPPEIPELLTHLLLPFGTSSTLEDIEKLSGTHSLVGSQKWMMKLRVLMENKAHKKLLQKLESMGDQEVSFEDLCDQENAQENSMDDYLVVGPKWTLQFDHDMRDVMTRGDKNAMKKHPDVFYLTGWVSWTVRSPYWNVALATDDQGNRLLSDEVLDRVLPKWRQILTGETIPTPKYGVVDSFRSWLAREEKKASDLGKPWPNTPIKNVPSISEPKFESPRTPEPYYRPPDSRLRSTNASRLSPLESTPDVTDVTDSEQIEMLREILAEVKELRRMIGQIIERNEALEFAENQMYGSWHQGYPPIPQAMQPNYYVPPDDPFVSAQYYDPALEQDWQHWNSQYYDQDPTTMPDPGAGSAHLF
ncbi:hypothetical protein PCG10_009691 [Penicillium crustosum]|uniref:Uncharacterized protein n=1 Tax=Penicillium crustosum TaxID=36656 RepID=A0A9P5L1G9_PENCR|nr:uncharacterized protein N7487_005643 [Penicillium crustosum]KAF7519923.1 hypothetical protein PCG10_009691 [Penicillium crustosum]KAJ5411284.1 hypothetical protein N7487_005643 [Penicillium crustosum]